MDAARLEAYLHEQIPLSKAMQVRVLEAGPRLRLAADLKPNLNHKKTAFGGSLYALAVLAGWSSVRLHMEAAGLEGEIVIGKSQCRYIKAAREEFVAEVEPIEAAAWEQFRAAYTRKGKAPLMLAVDVKCGGEVVTQFSGTYVVIRPPA